MAKTEVKKDAASSTTKDKSIIKLTKNQKKKKFWKNHPKIVSLQDKEKKATSLPLPPKAAQDFSSNWRALQALLTSEAKSPVTDSAPAKLPPKEKKAPKEEKEASKGKPKSEPRTNKPAPKINGGVKEVKIRGKETAEGSAVTDRRKGKKRKAEEDGGKHVAPGRKTVEESAVIDKRKGKRRKAEEDGGKHVAPRRKPAEDNAGDVPKIDLWFDDVDPEDIEAALGPEAAKVARRMQGMPEKKSDSVDTVLVKDKAFEGLTRTVAMDCEMVGVGEDGEESILARVSIVNQFGKCVYDKFVRPTERVTDYRTEVSGIRPPDVRGGEEYKVVQKEVSEILKGRILVGHALHNDLKILFLDHPKKAVRDTQKYKPFKQQVQSGRPSLKLLCEKILHVRVQTGEHSSVQDAQAAMRLYTMEKKNWEASIKAKYNRAKTEPPKQNPQTAR